MAAGVCFYAVTALRAESPFEITPDVVYGHKAGMALTYDVIRHKEQKNGAAVVFIMSRSWVSPWAPASAFVGQSGPEGFKDFPELAAKRHFRQLVQKGYVLFIVRHGSAPYFKVPDMVADVRRALRHIRLHAPRLAIDPERIGVYGGSAGGQLALMLGTASDNGQRDSPEEVERTSNRVAVVVAYFPVVDFRGGSVDFDPELADDVSPIAHVTPDDPPALLICGSKDGLLGHSQRMYDALQKSSVPSRLIVIEGAGHGFQGADEDRASAALIEWFDQYLARPVAAAGKSDRP
jgi:acetyl esterase/lipase